MRNIKRKVSFSINGKPILTEDFISMMELYWKGEFRFTKTNYTTQYTPVIVECRKHGLLKITPKYAFNYKHPCDKCSIELYRAEQLKRLLELAKKRHGEKYDYGEVCYVNGTTKVTIGCPNHGSFITNLNDHANKGTGCPSCAVENGRMSKDDFLEKSKIKHGDKYDYSKVDILTSNSYVTIICKDHGEFTQRASSHTAGNGCKLCFQHNVLRSNTDDFIKKAIDKHGKKYDYSKVNYVTNRTKVEIICPNHGSFFQTPLSHLTGGNSCHKCRESKGERMLSVMLDKLNIPYKQEVRFKGFKYAYDFYLQEHEILIEYHGIQHYEPVEKFGGLEALKLTKIRDQSKKKLAKDLKLDLIVLNHVDLENGKLFKKLKTELLKLNVEI